MVQEGSQGAGGGGTVQEGISQGDSAGAARTQARAQREQGTDGSGGAQKARQHGLGSSSHHLVIVRGVVQAGTVWQGGTLSRGLQVLARSRGGRPVQCGRRCEKAWVPMYRRHCTAACSRHVGCSASRPVEAATRRDKGRTREARAGARCSAASLGPAGGCHIRAAGKPQISEKCLNTTMAQQGRMSPFWKARTSRRVTSTSREGRLCTARPPAPTRASSTAEERTSIRKAP